MRQQVSIQRHADLFGDWLGGHVVTRRGSQNMVFVGFFISGRNGLGGSHVKTDNSGLTSGGFLMTCEDSKSNRSLNMETPKLNTVSNARKRHVVAGCWTNRPK